MLKKLTVLIILCSLVFGLSEKPPLQINGFQAKQKISIPESCINPTYIAVDKTAIYITDDFSNTVYKLNHHGIIVQKLHTESIQPAGIAIYADYIYIADKSSNTILKLKKNLDLHSMTKITINTTTKFTPHDLYFDQLGNSYITDDQLNQAIQINDTGRIAWQKNAINGNTNTLNEPRAIAGDGTTIYIADHTNKTIHIYADDAVHTLGKFVDLRGIALSQEKVLAAADYNGSITIFYDNLVKQIIEDFNNAMINPYDLTFSDKKLYVLDPVNRNILIYNPY